MKILASLGLAAVLLSAVPAAAGPAGMGLTFTEEVAKKNHAKKRAAAQAQPKPQAAADCAAPKAGQSDAANDTCRAS